MYRPALVVKTFLNKRNECGHVFDIFSGGFPSAMMEFAFSGLITPAAFSAGKILVQTRKERGITQYRLAHLTGRTIQQISQIERW